MNGYAVSTRRNLQIPPIARFARRASSSEPVSVRLTRSSIRGSVTAFLTFSLAGLIPPRCHLYDDVQSPNPSSSRLARPKMPVRKRAPRPALQVAFEPGCLLARRKSEICVEGPRTKLGRVGHSTVIVPSEPGLQIAGHAGITLLRLGLAAQQINVEQR